MGKIDKLAELVDDLNLPKHVLKKSQELLKTLFGPSMGDTSGIIADQVKLRRFKNQINILEQANEFVKAKGIDPKSLNLKVLAPMVEYSSLEENETLQEKWSKLIANALTEERHVRLEQKCVEILSKISPDEAILLDKVFDLVNELRIERFDRYRSSKRKPKDINSPNDINLASIYLSNNKIKEAIGSALMGEVI